MVQRVGQYWPERINMRVPNMVYDGAFGQNPKGPMTFDMQDVGVPLAALSTTNIMSVVALPADGVAYVAANFVGAQLPMAVPGRGRWGRTLQFVGSAAGTSVLEVVGRDYLGQILRKRVTLTGSTPVTALGGATLTAFWSIESVTVISGTAAINLSIGTNNQFGLPYRMNALLSSFMDGVSVTAHTFVAPILTDPQTSALGDPRGLITFSTAPNSVRMFTLTGMFDDTNMYGVAQNTA